MQVVRRAQLDRSGGPAQRLPRDLQNPLQSPTAHMGSAGGLQARGRQPLSGARPTEATRDPHSSPTRRADGSDVQRTVGRVAPHSPAPRAEQTGWVSVGERAALRRPAPHPHRTPPTPSPQPETAPAQTGRDATEPARDVHMTQEALPGCGCSSPVCHHVHSSGEVPQPESRAPPLHCTGGCLGPGGLALGSGDSACEVLLEAPVCESHSGLRPETPSREEAGHLSSTWSPQEWLPGTALSLTLLAQAFQVPNPLSGQRDC